MNKGKSTKKKLQPFEIGELDQYLFGQGNHYEIYQKMGAHKVVYKGKEGDSEIARRRTHAGLLLWETSMAGILKQIIWSARNRSVYTHALSRSKRRGSVQILHRDTAGKTDFQGGSVCKLCGAQTRNRIKSCGYLSSEMDG